MLKDIKDINDLQSIKFHINKLEDKLNNLYKEFESYERSLLLPNLIPKLLLFMGVITMCVSPFTHGIWPMVLGFTGVGVTIIMVMISLCYHEESHSLVNHRIYIVGQGI